MLAFKGKALPQSHIQECPCLTVLYGPNTATPEVSTDSSEYSRAVNRRHTVNRPKIGDSSLEQALGNGSLSFHNLGIIQCGEGRWTAMLQPQQVSQSTNVNIIFSGSRDWRGCSRVCKWVKECHWQSVGKSIFPGLGNSLEPVLTPMVSYDLMHFSLWVPQLEHPQLSLLSWLFCGVIWRNLLPGTGKSPVGKQQGAPTEAFYTWF